MCGLAGYSGVTGQEERTKLVVGLGSGIDSRGGHASGYISIHKHSVKFCKKLGKWMKAKQRFIQTAAEGGACMMHARFATCGNRDNVQEAHPYAIKRNGQIVLWGAHNGQIPDAFKCAEKHGRKISVDSQEIFELIADGEYKALNELSGYGVITWVEASDRDTINLVKLTNSGDIAIAKLKEGGIVWASTWDILKEAIKLAGLTAASKYDGLEVGCLYQITGSDIFKTNVNGIKTAELWRSRNYNYSWKGEYSNDDDEGWSSRASTSTTNTTPNTSYNKSESSNASSTIARQGLAYGAIPGYVPVCDGKVDHTDGTIAWYKDGKLHREDGPAIERKNGDKEWHYKGFLHREDGGPAVEKADGDKEWFRHGIRHRENGPAIEKKNGNFSVFYHGKLHCLTGPALYFKQDTNKSEAPPWSGYYVDGLFFNDKNKWEEAAKAFKTLQEKSLEENKSKEPNAASSKLEDDLASLEQDEKDEIDVNMSKDHAFLRELRTMWDKWEKDDDLTPETEKTRYLTRGMM